jgi:hypothetical protein
MKQSCALEARNIIARFIFVNAVLANMLVKNQDED